MAKNRKQNIRTDIIEKKSFFLENVPHLLFVALVVLITFLFLRPLLDNQFTNWDDPEYLTNNPLIKDLSAKGLKNIFSNPCVGIYHPFTILSYALEYSFVLLNPFLYHFDNLLLHLLVSVLVYWLTYLLTKKKIAALFTSLLFSIHPMHIETVAWISDRKDLLCAIFYFSSCIVYVYYLQKHGFKQWIYYTCALVLFACSLLSKPTSVVLPISLVLIDYWFERKKLLQIFIEKIPFFILSLIFGFLSFYEQANTGAVKINSIAYSFFDRIFIGTYSLFNYIWKAIVPLQLCSFYGYPQKGNGGLPIYFYIIPIFLIALVYVVWKWGSKNKMLVFGLLFFIVNIVLLLQFIPVGDAIIAERYSYISYFGLFVLGSNSITTWLERVPNQSIKQIVFSVLLGYCLILAWGSNARCRVWYDAQTLWTDVLNKQPEATVAQNNLGALYFDKFMEAKDLNDKKNYGDSAYILLTKAITVDSNYASSYITLGMLEAYHKNFTQAKSCFYKALALPIRNNFAAQAYLGLSAIYMATNNLDSAGYYNQKAIQSNYSYPGVHLNYAKYFAAKNQPDSAIIEYSIAIEQNPDYYENYLRRGEAFYQIKQIDLAVKDFDKAINLSPQRGEIYYDRSICFYQQGNKPLALQDVELAIRLGFREIDTAYYNELRKSEP